MESIGVAPLAGAWIEIEMKELIIDCFAGVAPLAGAWIEIIDILLILV